ncbi:hypothetical protein [Solimonas flava]|uniref:hypothetical protein n=1 Tax=Solimonas flava TaxID=415849 RepID=UPI0012B60A1A|nr:hypothetical protein [Solimonas flava]
MIVEALIATSVLSVGAALHAARLTAGDNEKQIRAARVSSAIALMVLALTWANYYENKKRADEVSDAELNLNVAEQIAQRTIPVLDAYFSLLQRHATVFNYLSYQEGLKQAHAFSSLLQWENQVTPTVIRELEQARNAHASLVQSAKEVLALSDRFPTRVPSEALDWASLTLGITFDQVPRYFDPYKELPEAVEYAEKLGRALSSAKETVRAADGTITRKE